MKKAPPETWVARWYIFKPKNPIWVNLGRPKNEDCWNILWTFWNILQPFYILYGHLVILVANWVYFPCFGTLYEDKSGIPACNDAPHF
jgi:hypothetical protein